MTSRPTNSRDPRRGANAHRVGFTLIELLVVITIISILTALIAVASVGFIGQARAAATRTTIKKVDEAIMERVSAVNRWHMRPNTKRRHDMEVRGWINRWAAYGLIGTSGTQGGYSFSEEELMVLSRKNSMFEMLPMTREELSQAYWFWAKFESNGTIDYISINNVPVPYLSAAEQADMVAFLDDIDGDASNNVAGTSPGVPSALNRPGEIFFYALLNAPVFGGQRILEEDFSSSELIDPDGDGVPELADAWGNELRFYRWPTRLVNNGETLADDWTDNVGRRTLMPNAPILDLKSDPDDRAGFFALNTLVLTAFQTYYHDVNTWHAPLVVSAGPDGRLGLYEPNNVTDFGSRAAIANEDDLFDNITNHNSNGGL